MTFSVAEYEWPARAGVRPFAHQKTTVRFALANKRCFILNDMGTGKTLSAIWACDILLRAQKIRRVLIIGPISSMTSVWYNEWKLNIPTRRIIVAHGMSKEKRIGIIRNAAYEVVIMNHDGIKSIEEELVRQQFDVIIIDELTAYKANSERTKCMARVSLSARAVWGMTGDATPNSPLEAFWQVKVVNPYSKWLPKYYGQFRDACMVQINEMIWVPKPESPQVVSMVMQPSIRFTREQCVDLPETTYQVLDVPITPQQAQYYELMRKEAYAEWDNGTISAVNAGVKMNKLLQICGGAVRDDEANVVDLDCQPRLDAMVELLEESPGKKLVVFARYRAVIAKIVEFLRTKKYAVDCIHGDVSQKNRGAIIDRFQNGDLNVIVLQPRTAAHSITLTRSCTMLWFTLVSSNEEFSQGVARIVRISQTMKTFIYMFVSTTAEKRVAKVLQERGDMAAETRRLFEERML